MFRDKTYLVRKGIIFLFLSIMGIGIFIFWIGSLDFSRPKEKWQKDQGQLENIFTNTEFSQRKTHLGSFLKDQFTSSSDNQIIKEREENQTQEKKNLSLSLGNIVFKEQETWVYLNIKNQNQARVLFRSGSESEIKIIQNKKEYPETRTQKLIDYPLKDIIETQEEMMGTLHFPGIDPEGSFILFIKGVKIEGEEEHFNFLFKVE